MAFDHVRRLKHRLNAKIPGSKRRKLNTDSRWLNSDEGLAQCERQEVEERAKAAEKQARADERQAEEHERQRQWEQQDPNIPFVGSLNSRKKVALQDIAYSLGLDVEGKVEDQPSLHPSLPSTRSSSCPTNGSHSQHITFSSQHHKYI